MESDARFFGIKLGRAFRQSVTSFGDNVSGATYSLRGKLTYGDHYQYRPLNSSEGEIRLLHLRPGLPSDPLRCSLKHVRIAVSENSRSVPDYEAVSYACGNPTPCRSCIIDGTQVKIPSNAAQALRRFRMPDVTRVLWIDSLCINQYNIVERGEQVTLMAQIYKCCKRCLVWLGRDSGQAKDAFTIIHKILESAAQYPDRFPGRLQIIQPTDAHHYLSLPIGLDFDPEPLDWLFSRPWFSRKWTIQEATLPDKVTCFCGSVDISIIDLAQAALYLMIKNFPKKDMKFIDTLANIVTCYYSLLARREQVPSGRTRLNIGTILDATRQSKVTDPRDTIYAILGLFEGFFGADQDLMQTLLRPDYQKTIGSVLCRVVKASIYHDKQLRCLGHVLQRLGPGLLDADDIPSWVPLWHLDLEEHLLTSFDPLCIYFDASDGLEVDIQPFDADRFEDDFKLLHCKSTVIDTVSHVHDYLDPEAMTKPREVKELILWLWEHLQKQSSPYQCEDGRWLLKALSLTLTAGKGFTTFGIADKEEIDAFATFIKAIVSPDLPDCLQQQTPKQYQIEFSLLEEYPQHRELLCSLGAMQRAAMHRIAFVTSRGITGMGPSKMQIGDVVVLIHGCPWPAILRPRGDEYEFIEVCYAHGYMWGPEHWIPGIDLEETTLTLR